MKLTLILPSLCLPTLLIAKDCDPSKPERWNPTCISSSSTPSRTTISSTSASPSTSTSTTSMPTSRSTSISSSTTSPASLTVATETICYLGAPTPTTLTVSTAHQVCTMTTYLTVTTSTIYGSPSCGSTVVTRRVSSSVV